MDGKLVFIVFIHIVTITKITSGQSFTTFPNGFLIGTASSAYQIEGAWNTSGKGLSVWDTWTHNEPWMMRDLSNGDVACDSYNNYEKDIELLQNLGVDFYRFSLSWPRILPNGLANEINEDGIRYYHNLIDRLLAKGIQPFVTLYHWDHPDYLEKLGGWTNDLMVDSFGKYARIVFKEFGSKVKYFTTINEPSVVCAEGYGGDTKAPAKRLGRFGMYMCMHNVLKAHATAYHIYNNEFRKEQKGMISIVIPCQGVFPKDPNEKEAVDIMFQFMCGWTAHPIFSKTGDYPQIMKERIADNSKIEGYSRSLLPEFSPEWVDYIRGTADFYALNHYTSILVEAVPRDSNGRWFEDKGVKASIDPAWPGSASDWLKVVPEGFAQVLEKIKSEYGNPPVYVMENGISDTGIIVDNQRVEYLHSYMKAMLSAIYDNGCNVMAYTAWSLTDNFEWNRGYTEKFGLYHVDFNSPARTRTPKSSVGWLKRVIKTRTLQPAHTIPKTVHVR